MKAPKVGKITFALVDVKGGRKVLSELVEDHTYKIPITISGWVTGEWSGDDGTSREFEIDVTESIFGKPLRADCTCIRCTGKDHIPAGRRNTPPKRKDRSDPEGGIPGRASGRS